MKKKSIFCPGCYSDSHELDKSGVETKSFISRGVVSVLIILFLIPFCLATNTILNTVAGPYTFESNSTDWTLTEKTTRINYHPIYGSWSLNLSRPNGAVLKVNTGVHGDRINETFYFKFAQNDGSGTLIYYIFVGATGYAGISPRTDTMQFQLCTQAGSCSNGGAFSYDEVYRVEYLINESSGSMKMSVFKVGESLLGTRTITLTSLNYSVFNAGYEAYGSSNGISGVIDNLQIQNETYGLIASFTNVTPANNTVLSSSILDVGVLTNIDADNCTFYDNYSAPANLTKINGTYFYNSFVYPNGAYIYRVDCRAGDYFYSIANRTIHINASPCIEVWGVNTSACIGGFETITYADSADCGTFDDLPGDNGTTSACGGVSLPSTVTIKIDSSIWIILLWIALILACLICASRFYEVPLLFSLTGILLLGFAIYLKYGLFPGLTGVDAFAENVFSIILYAVSGVLIGLGIYQQFRNI